MLDLVEIFKKKGGAEFLLIVSGCVIIFASTIKTVDLPTLQFSPYKLPSHVSILSGVFLVFSGVVSSFFKERMSSKLCPDINGQWIYRVIDTEEIYTHKGLCEIKQSGSSLHVHGQRLLMSKKGENGFDQRACKINWASEWGVCEEKAVRFEYHIDIPTSHVSALCRMEIQKEEGASRMSGTYNRLPPFPRDDMNTSYGSIEMWKPDEKEKFALLNASENKFV